MTTAYNGRLVNAIVIGESFGAHALKRSSPTPQDLQHLKVPILDRLLDNSVQILAYTGILHDHFYPRG